MPAKQISLKLLVHKEQNKVIYAESENDFVDVLFSFLTMPIGTVVRLAGKQSEMGSISTLYESLEDLDTKFLQTKACKEMLLHPKSAAEEWRKRLIVDIDDTKPTAYYRCLSDCFSKVHHLTSTVGKARCPCGRLMDKKLSKKKLKVVACGEDGVFVKGNMRFMIRDDLQVSPVSTTEAVTLLNELGISDMTVLEERDVNIGAGEVLHLLKCLLLSKTPLTEVFLLGQDTFDRVDQDFNVMSLDYTQSFSQVLHLLKCLLPSNTPSTEVFLRGQDTIDRVDQDFNVMFLDSKDMPQFQSLTEKESGSESKKMSVKLFLSKSNNKVLYAECGKEFPDLLFSFLAFPLGSILKVSGGFASLICLNNLYNSVKLLSFNSCIISEESKDMLLDPKLPPYFSCDMQPLQIQEQVPWQPTFFNCDICNRNGNYILDDSPINECPHGNERVQLSTINPKYPNVVKELGGAFTAGQAMFMVTDELNVKPLSSISGISLFSKLNIFISDLEEHVASVGEEEALSLLKASLISRTALSDAFILNKPNQFAVASYKRGAASARDVMN